MAVDDIGSSSDSGIGPGAEFALQLVMAGCRRSTVIERLQDAGLSASTATILADAALRNGRPELQSMAARDIKRGALVLFVGLVLTIGAYLLDGETVGLFVVAVLLGLGWLVKGLGNRWRYRVPPVADVRAGGEGQSKE